MKSFLNKIILIVLWVSICGINEQTRACELLQDSPENGTSTSPRHKMNSHFKTFHYRLTALGEELPFPFPITGFAEPEKTHLWTLGEEATITVNVIQSKGRIKNITFPSTFGLCSSKQNQHLTVLLNDKVVGQYVYSMHHPAHTIVVPFSTDLTGEAKIKFSMLTACLPNMVDSSNLDPRKLAIGFRTAELTLEAKMSYFSLGSHDISNTSIEDAHSPVKLSHGFSPSEPHYRWTDGNEAIVQLDMTNPKNRFKRIEFETFGFISESYSQVLIVFLNNVFNCKYLYDKDNYERIVTIDIPPEVVDIAMLKFEMPNACQPCLLDPSNLDPRKLAIAFKSLCLLSDPETKQSDQSNEEKQEQNKQENEEKDKKLKELEDQVQEMQDRFLEMNGIKNSKSLGQTIKWMPFSSSSFIHTDGLLSVPDTSELTKGLKAKLEALKEVIATVKTKITERTKVQCLRDVEPNDISSFAEVKLKWNDQKFYPSLPHVMEPCGTLIAETITLYDEYDAIVLKVPEGLGEYSKKQTLYIDLVMQVDQILKDETKISFCDFMQLFNQKKQDFVKKVKDLKLLPEANSAGYDQLIDLVELDLSSNTLSEFTRALDKAPADPNVKGYSNLPFIVMNQRASGAGKCFEGAKFITRVHHKTKEEMPGFDKFDPFNILRNRMQTSEHPKIDIVESMYLMQFFNHEWNQLKELFGEFKMELTNCKISLLNPKIKATVNLILNNPNFLEKDKITHVKAAKDLKDLLYPILLSEHEDTWVEKGHQGLRANLKKLYTTYMALQKFGLFLNERNPKIKEFHEGQ